MDRARQWREPGDQDLNRTGGIDRTDTSVGELVEQATEQLSDLVRQEILSPRRQDRPGRGAP